MAKVLLVEDDDNLREIYEARLMAEGYTIASARNGEEALVVAKNERPDLIISDVMMPNISGFDMLDILRNTQGMRDTKVIMLTALGQAEDKVRADKLGADRYLVKSQVTLEDIVNTARELLNPDPTPATPGAPIAQSVPVQPQPGPVFTQTPVAAAPPVGTHSTVTPPVAAPAAPQQPVAPMPAVPPMPIQQPVAPSPAPAMPPQSAQIPVSAPAAHDVTPPAPQPTVVSPQPAVGFTAQPMPEPQPTTPAPEPEPPTPPQPVDLSMPNPAPAAANEQPNMALPPMEMIDPSTVQTTSSEAAVVQAQIDDFARNQLPATDASEVVSPTVDTAVEATLAAADTSTATESSEPIVAQPAITVQPEPVAEPPAPPMPTEDQPVDKPAPEPAEEPNIVLETIKPEELGPNAAAATDSETPQPEVQKPVEEPDYAVNNDTDGVAVAHKKVIQPINDIKSAPDINELLAKEVEKTQETPAAPAVQQQPAAPQPAPAQSAPGGVVTPKSPAVEQFDPDDPSSIAL